MPKVKTCQFNQGEIKFQASLNVDSKGIFSILRPGSPEEWPGQDMKITGPVAETVEIAWFDAAKDLCTRTKKEKKVILVHFDSTLRENGKRHVFTDRDCMLILECAIALETTITRGELVTRKYTRHPDYSGVHSTAYPFPSRMLLSSSDFEFHLSRCVVVDWSKEVEDTLVRACKGVLAVVDLLDKTLETPETISLAASSGLPMLPIAPKHESK